MVPGYKAGEDRQKHNSVITSWPVNFSGDQGACHAQRVKTAAAKELQGFVESDHEKSREAQRLCGTEMTSDKQYRSCKRPWHGYEVNEMPQRPSYKG